MMLTAKQRAVLYGLSAGLSLADIATRMQASSATIAAHRRSLGRRLDLANGNIVLLLRAAVRDGHLPADVLAIPVDTLLAKMR